MAARPSVLYRGVIDAVDAWLDPTPDMDIDRPALYYTVYDASRDVRSVRDGRVWLGIAEVADLAPVIFAEWRQAPERSAA